MVLWIVQIGMCCLLHHQAIYSNATAILTRALWLSCDKWIAAKLTNLVQNHKEHCMSTSHSYEIRQTTFLIGLPDQESTPRSSFQGQIWQEDDAATNTWFSFSSPQPPRHLCHGIHQPHSLWKSYKDTGHLCETDTKFQAVNFGQAMPGGRSRKVCLSAASW